MKILGEIPVNGFIVEMTLTEIRQVVGYYNKQSDAPTAVANDLDPKVGQYYRINDIYDEARHSIDNFRFLKKSFDKVQVALNELQTVADKQQKASK